MKRIIFVSVLLSTFFVQAQEVTSPNKNLLLKFTLQEDGTPSYVLTYKGKYVIKPSKLGFELKDKQPLLNDFVITDTTKSSFDETWMPVWGEVKTIRNHYNELAVTLNQKETGHVMIVRFRVLMTVLDFDTSFLFKRILPIS